MAILSLYHFVGGDPMVLETTWSAHLFACHRFHKPHFLSQDLTSTGDESKGLGVLCSTIGTAMQGLEHGQCLPHEEAAQARR
jgi:hypothetical protein